MDLKRGIQVLSFVVFGFGVFILLRYMSLGTVFMLTFDYADENGVVTSRVGFLVGMAGRAYISLKTMQMRLV